IEGTATRRFGGTGLGLVLTKEFSALLEGNIMVKSAPGEGSEFIMECKAPRSREAQENPPGAPIKHAATFKPQKSKDLLPAEDSNGLPKVLIAEDNEELADYIATVLGTFCHLRIAKDGEEAWEMVREWDPAAILSDVMMPKLDGVNLCKKIKADPLTSLKPVILLTALTHREALLKGWEAGADEYLFKPFYPNELMTRIKSILALLEERRLREKEKIRLKEFEDFSWFASHDLQEPLRIIVSYTQLLQKRFTRQLGADGDEFIGFIVKASKRMQQLIRALIEYDRISSKEIHRADTDCEQVLQEALKNLEISFAESKASVTHGKLPTLY